jgi:hypothetical protein
MADILRQFEIIAATTRMVAPTKKAMVAMLTIQSSVEKATSQEQSSIRSVYAPSAACGGC